MYFTSIARQPGNLSSPQLTTQGGCVKFYYNMEGGVSVELKVYLQKDNVRTLVFYANGIYVEKDEWIEGWFEIPNRAISVEFEAYGDIYFQRPSIVAIDDVEFIEGQNCPPSCKCNTIKLLFL